MLSGPTWKASCTKVDCDLPSSMCDSDSWIKTGSSFDPCAGLGFISKKSGAELNFVICTEKAGKTHTDECMCDERNLDCMEQCQCCYGL